MHDKYFSVVAKQDEFCLCNDRLYRRNGTEKRRGNNFYRETSERNLGFCAWNNITLWKCIIQSIFFKSFSDFLIKFFTINYDRLVCNNRSVLLKIFKFLDYLNFQMFKFKDWIFKYTMLSKHSTVTKGEKN